MRRLILALLAVLATTLPAYATVRNVPSQYPTIQAGINASVNGDTVLVAPGTYTENINFNGHSIILASEYLLNSNTTAILSTIIDGNGNGSTVTLDHNEDSSTKVTGFSIINGSNSGIRTVNASPEIRYNVIRDNNASNGGGLNIQGGNVIISGNRIIGNSAGQGGAAWVQASDAQIEHNIMSYNSSTGVGACLIIYSGGSTSIINNDICFNSHPGDHSGAIYLIYGSSLISIVNNIVYSNNCYGISQWGASNYSVIYNEVFQNSSGNYNGITPDPSNISNDPLLTGGDPFDYHLQSTSPCIDTGDPASPLDPDGTRADMGAFYYHQTSSYYVSPSGDDITGDGSEANPFQTIAHTLGLTTPIDTILALPGAYPEALFIDHGITLLSTGGPEVTTLQGLANKRVITIHYSPDTVRVSDFTITGGYPIGDSLGDRGGAILAIASPIVIENCHIQGNRTPFAGANCTGGALHIRQGSGFVIRDSQITGNAADRGGAIMVVESAGGRIERNLISDNTSVANAAGVYLYATANLHPWVTLSGNTITGNRGCLQGNGVTSLRTNLELSGNILAQNTPSEGCDPAACFGLWAVQCSTALDCNDLYTNAPAEYYSLNVLPRLGTYFPGIRDISSDPLFCHPDTGNFQIANESPCAATNNICGTLIGAYDVGCAVDRTVWHVATTGDDLTGWGSPERPFRTIQRGIDASSDGDTVLIAAGTYTGEGNRRIGFEGKALTIIGAGMDNTILDAQWDLSVFITGNTQADSNICIQDLAISNSSYGVYTDYTYWIFGLNMKGVKVSDCVTRGIGNSAFGGGTNFSFNECIFENNYMAVSLDGPQAGFSNCRFNNNNIAIYSNPYGLHNHYIDSCTFSGNSISLQGGSFTITGTAFSGGNPAIAPMMAGHSYMANSSIENAQVGLAGSEDFYFSIFKSEFRNNQAAMRFGGGLAEAANLIIDSCVIVNNNVGIDWRIHLLLKNSMLNNNGMPVRFHGWNLRVENCTIAENDSGGISSNVWQDFALEGTIISNNTGIGLQHDNIPPINTISCNNIFSNSGGNYVGIPDQTGLNGNISVDPLFCDTASGDFHLAADSPCREDAGACGQIGALEVGCGPRNQPPGPFALLSPMDGDSTCNTMPTLIWSRSVDPDPEDTICYTLYWSLDSTFVDIDSLGGILDTTYTFTPGVLLAKRYEMLKVGYQAVQKAPKMVEGKDAEKADKPGLFKAPGQEPIVTEQLPPNNTIYWKVKAIDRGGLAILAAPESGFSFYIEPYPDVVALQDTVSLSWAVGTNGSTSIDFINNGDCSAELNAYFFGQTINYYSSCDLHSCVIPAGANDAVGLFANPYCICAPSPGHYYGYAYITVNGYYIGNVIVDETVLAADWCQMSITVLDSNWAPIPVSTALYPTDEILLYGPHTCDMGVCYEDCGAYYNFEYSTDAGGSWIQIGSEYIHPIFSWHIPDVYSDSVYFRLSGYDWYRTPVDDTLGPFIILGTPPVPRTIYVDDSNTSGPWEGTSEHPYNLIQTAVNEAFPRDTVLVAEGTYLEHVTDAGRDGITLLSNQMAHIIGDSLRGIELTGVRDWLIRGFEITGCTNHGLYMEDCQAITVERCFSHHNSNGYGCHGLGATSCDSVLFQNNVSAYNNSYGNCAGIWIWGTPNAVLLNNTVTSNKTDGIIFSMTGEGGVVKNNIVMNNGGHGIEFQAGSDSGAVAFNDVLNNFDGDYEGCVSVEGEISVTPEFGDSLSFDYSLRAHSPCIDSGDPALPLDPDSSRADMGAFYYHQTQIEPFALASPDSGAVIASNLPALFWNRAIHNDTDVVITYKAYWDSDPLFGSADSSAMMPDTLFALADSLTRSARYYWKIRSDGFHAFSRESGVWNFYIDGYPTETAALWPLAGESLDSLSVLLWTRATDPDVEDSVTYTIQIGSDSTFAFPVVDVSGINGLGFSGVDTVGIQMNMLSGWTGLLSDSAYFWRVKADDLYGLSSSCSEPGSFVFMPHARVPVIDIVTEPIAATLLQGQVAIETLLVRNTGEADLIIGLSAVELPPALALELPGDQEGEEAPPKPLNFWLFAAPAADTISSGDSAEVMVTLSATSVAYGEYPGEIRIRSNDPADTLIVIPAWLTVTSPGCSYVPGDVNGNGTPNGIDVVYFVNHLKNIGPAPPDACSCGPWNIVFVAADANGSCSANGIDVTYMVNFFKGGPALMYCPDCPPGEMMAGEK